MPALMFQGTGSNVGKSLLVAGLCRVLRNRGISVAPFKPQNMSNNAAVTVDGGEIGRAQALQARAAGRDPHTDMNPVLLKPESETGSQIIVQGRRHATAKAREYAALNPQLMRPVLESFKRLKNSVDIVLVEGAGSPAEVNLRKGDIANMGFARAANVPVVLVGDIDRGGVIAQLVGTKVVLDPADEAMIGGFIVNKFRGDVSLFDDGYRMLETRTTWQGFGVLPYFSQAWKLPAEDALDIATPLRPGKPHIVCLGLSRIANFDDLDPLSNDPNLQVSVLRAGQPIPADATLVIIPGTKSTRGDLEFLKSQGWDIDLRAHHRRGGHILGICGGYQILGKTVSDPEGIEGPAGTSEGLGFLDVETRMSQNKSLTRVNASYGVRALTIEGYEIHIGETHGPDCARPFAYIEDRPEGAQSLTGQVKGTYLHGLFSNDLFRKAFLTGIGLDSGIGNYESDVEQTVDALAAHIDGHLDIDQMLGVAGYKA
ncbi:MAG: cobyric acid synthase [Paracoccaceae bacterium]